MSTVDTLKKLADQKRKELEELEADIRSIEEIDDGPLPLVVDEVEFDAEPTVLNWLVGGLIANQSITMLVADPGLGKTTFVSQLTLALANGRPFLGANVPQPARTLTLAAEGSRAAFRARRHATGRALGVQPSKLWTIQHERITDFRVTGPLFERMVKESAASLVVLDTLGYFAENFKENDANEWKEKVAKPLRSISERLGVSFLLVHHQPKVNESNRDNRTGRGSGAMLADCDHFWLLEKVSGEGNEARRDFIVKKNKYGRAYDLRLRFDEMNALFVEEGR